MEMAYFKGKSYWQKAEKLSWTFRCNLNESTLSVYFPHNAFVHVPQHVLTSGRHFQLTHSRNPIKNHIYFSTDHSHTLCSQCFLPLNNKTVERPSSLRDKEMHDTILHPSVSTHGTLLCRLSAGQAAGTDVGHKINFLCRLTKTGCSLGPNKI